MQRRPIWAVSGTRIIVTTLAIPAVWDDFEVAVVPVKEEGHEVAVLEGLDDSAAVDLLKQSGVRGTPEELLQAATQYDNHPLALTVVGRLLKKRYGGRLQGLKSLSPVDAPDRLA